MFQLLLKKMRLFINIRLIFLILIYLYNSCSPSPNSVKVCKYFEEKIIDINNSGQLTQTLWEHRSYSLTSKDPSIIKDLLRIEKKCWAEVKAGGTANTTQKGKVIYYLSVFINEESAEKKREQISENAESDREEYGLKNEVFINKNGLFYFTSFWHKKHQDVSMFFPEVEVTAENLLPDASFEV